ncbi:NYN domain-containing protein [Suillus paluster]|uniref:NYN domain-containing protein n=1 Tax=Suillus paluster TaxID=48578 RepID=UPI001B878E33|nr:NYN domain-containing protein [Suillus paluster]KAG1732621.1 NYN domain-containing protein [Suillus paluster]
MSNYRKVAIFWDYENCSPPLNSQGHTIVNGIQRIAHVFGHVTSFKAYLDIGLQPPRSVRFRSDLQSSGVSITDCPHNGKKEVVDKMILVDMLAFAIDNPSPATIILIAGDRDYAYAISTLRLRQYNITTEAKVLKHEQQQCLEQYHWFEYGSNIAHHHSGKIHYDRDDSRVSELHDPVSKHLPMYDVCGLIRRNVDVYHFMDSQDLLVHAEQQSYSTLKA